MRLLWNIFWDKRGYQQVKSASRLTIVLVELGDQFLTDAGQYVIRFGDMLPKGIHPASPVLDEDVQNRKPLLSSTQGQSGAQEMQQLQAAATEVSPHILLGEPTLNGNGFCPLQKSAALHHPAFVSDFWGFSFPDMYKSCPLTTMQCNRR